MVRLFGLSKKHRGKKKLSPSAATPEGRRERHPMYQYALNEFAQTVPAGSSNDAGRLSSTTTSGSANGNMSAPSGSWTYEDNNSAANDTYQDYVYRPQPVPPSSVAAAHHDGGGGVPIVGQSQSLSSTDNDSTKVQPSRSQAAMTVDHSSISNVHSNDGTVASSTAGHSGVAVSASERTAVAGTSTGGGARRANDPIGAGPATMGGSSMVMMNMHSHHHPLRSPFEAGMPDASYTEYYGDAYLGGSIKYVYPSGYQSMRPRSGPWKLSIVVCLLFTWLSIFIVGHCSDQVDSNQLKYYNNAANSYYDDDANNANNGGEAMIDDDTLVMDIRWCGSRPLYLMWVCSMLITGLAAAYCSVIGYIKVRDFAVGNTRSQPPGVTNGSCYKSDYYVQIQDTVAGTGVDGGIGGAPPHPYYPGTTNRSDAGSANSSTTQPYRTSIYQSDGTPQFWGSYIYRPTQAAVAITSR